MPPLQALLAHGQKLLLAARRKVSASILREVGERAAIVSPTEFDRLLRRAMGAAHRLGDDLVDHLELLEILRR